MKIVSPAQRKRIYAMSHQVGLSNEKLHLFLKNLTGKEHITELTRAEAWRFTEKFAKIIKEREKTRFPAITEACLTACTHRQQEEIRALVEDAGWTEGKIKDYIEQWGAKRVQALTFTLAEELIATLRAEVRTRRACRTAAQKEATC